MGNNAKIEKHSIPKTLFLHITPGLINFTAILLFLPLVQHFGLASPTAGYLMIPFAMVSVQLGILLYTSKKKTKNYNIFNIMPYKNKSRTAEYLIFVVIIVAWGVLTARILEPFETNIRDSLFAFVPDNIALRNIQLAQFSKNGLIFTAILGVIFNGIIAPISEELYFRGFLLPRINLPPIGAVILNAALFSLYHFFSPWNFFSRFILMVPIYYWVMKKSDIRFSLIAHIIGNLYSSVAILIMIL
ncbi:hypothetical protein FACS1894132_09120 [Clostridia bacterium]|nr:hypothetical protein FACS1894132_09120 [Clostridia bacterium]